MLEKYPKFLLSWLSRYVSDFSNRFLGKKGFVSSPFDKRGKYFYGFFLWVDGE
jgi:hypothetical protein